MATQDSEVALVKGKSSRTWQPPERPPPTDRGKWKERKR